MESNKDNLDKKSRPASFIKLAMRNMVKKGNKSLSHFLITFISLIGLLLLVATLAKPNLPA